MNDLIFVSIENWDDIWRRNQFVVAELARRYPAAKILFVGLARDASNDLRHRRVPKGGAGEAWNPHGLPNVWVTRPLKLLPNSIGAARRVNERMFRGHVRKVAKGLGIRRPVLWLNPHYAVHMIGQMGESAVVYDITDDWTCITQRAQFMELTRQQDAELCRRADAAIVCSERLYEIKRGMARNLHLIANGVDAEHYSTVCEAGGPIPELAKHWKKPVLGYTGTIHPDRVDVGLVIELARRMPKASIVLIGPSFLSRADTQRLNSCGNVFLPGPVSYQEIPNYMRAFDVCITPHRVSAFTESLNPIKLWEYLAAGKPMVSTDVAGFRDYPQFVRIAKGAGEFVEAIRAAINAPASCDADRQAEVRRHSWQERVDRIEQIIGSCTADPKMVAI